MNIFNKIKQQIASLFNVYKEQNNKTVSDSSAEKKDLIESSVVDLNNNGITDIEIYNINYSTHDFKTTEFAKTKLDNLLKNLLSTNNIYELEKKIVLLDIYGDCLNLHKALLPLMDLNIAYSIDLIGGAPRDFLLNNYKKIKDLDMLVTLSPSSGPGDKYGSYEKNKNLLCYNKILEQNWCTKEELESVDFSDNDILYVKHNKLLNLCLNRNLQLTSTKIFSIDERRSNEVVYGEDVLKELTGIIKVEGKQLHYPMEILMTDKSRGMFVQAIDFGICNVGLKIINLNRDDYFKLESFDNLHKNFFAAIDFFEDVQNKTITLNPFNKSFEQIEYSFGNHYKRIQEKYPEYTLKIPFENISEDTKKYIESVMLTVNLGDSLVSNEKVEVKKRRNKI
jgi:hypothetical protein